MLKTLVLAVALGGATAAGAQPGGPRPDPFGDATVSRADAQTRATTEFAALDTDHDGVLSPAELSAMFPEGPMRGMGAMMARMADTDRDGKLGRGEFVAAAMQRFDQADTDHDGQLTRAERDAARARMREQMRMRGRMERGGGPDGQMSGPMGGPMNGMDGPAGDRPMGRGDGVPMPPPPDDDGE